jgi:hypothetical protein
VLGDEGADAVERVAGSWRQFEIHGREYDSAVWFTVCEDEGSS